jgi:hemerythrin-like domain-containing protein
MHEINNADGNSINGVYCFLDKHVCISETVYGMRLFLLANISLPGKNLLCERLMKLGLAISDLGAKPKFDITPDEITPASYKDFVGRYKAYNVQPPPPPIITLSRTYKTDTSNANVQQEEFNMGKMAKALTPFFEKYKRFLISENIKLPDGYQVNEVCVTVNHGSSGVSIPAELPLKLVGSALGTGLTLLSAFAAAGGYGPFIGPMLIPLGIWQFEYSVSPVLHYNSDSSNVTISIGNESQEYPYYFFPPDLLIKEIFDFLGRFADRIPNILHKVEEYLNTETMKKLKEEGIAAADAVSAFTKSTIDTIINNLKDILNKIKYIIDPSPKKVWDEVEQLKGLIDNFICSIDSDILKNLRDNMGHLFEPFDAFVKEIISYINEELKLSISDFLKYISTLVESSKTKCFFNCDGMRGELPLTLNIIAINPGVTANLVACLTRTEEAMDKWRLETYNALYQSYLQQAAEYESKLFINGNANRFTKSPGTMREEEMLAIKERVLHCLNNHYPSNTSSMYLPRNNEYGFMYMNLFENAIDWNNVSYKLYNYGPNQATITAEKLGLFEGVDNRRVSFLKALWAQVLIPIQDNDMLEKGIGQYLTDANFDVSDLGINKETEADDMVALYQDLILGRELSLDKPETKIIADPLIPTDFIYVQDELPNKGIPCTKGQLI